MTGFLGFISFALFFLGGILFLFFFLIIYQLIGYFRFKAVSKIAQEEHLDKQQWSYSTHMFKVMYFSDRIITPIDSEKMVEAKRKLIKHVKKGWKIAAWWIAVEFILGLVGVVSLSVK